MTLLPLPPINIEGFNQTVLAAMINAKDNL